MNDLEMIKAFAKLDGLTGFEVYKSKARVAVREGWATLIPYNPITDLALNCAARDKYKVEIDYVDKIVFILDPSAHQRVNYSDDNAIPRAVISCILKSEGALEMINIHWMTKRSLSLLLNSGELYRGKSGKIKIKTHRELQGQVIRESVWAEKSSVISELRKEGK